MPEVTSIELATIGDGERAADAPRPSDGLHPASTVAVTKTPVRVAQIALEVTLAVWPIPGSAPV